jgi:hypothetical protein
MKKMQLSLSLFAMLVGLGLSFSSFKAAPAKAAKFSTSWFIYNGGPNSDPASYTEVSGTPSCPGNTALCAIQATVGTGSKPVITTSLQNEINFDLSHGTDSGNVSLQDQ